MSGPVPSWIPPLARTLLMLILLIFGVRMWLDGYSGAAVLISTGALTAELVGYGLTPAQAKTAIRDLEDVITPGTGNAP